MYRVRSRQCPIRHFVRFALFVVLVLRTDAHRLGRIVGDNVAFVFGHDASDIHYQIVGVEVHELDTLGIAPRHANALYRHANRHALLRDEHQLIIGQYFLDRYRVARLLGAMDGDDAFAAAPLDAVFVDWRALAHSLLGDDEQICLAFDDDHTDDLVVSTELDALNDGRVAAHLAPVGLLEPNRWPMSRRK